MGSGREPKPVCPACGAEVDPFSPTCFNCGHARPSALLKKGQVLSDRYELTSVLGRGGMGTVYEAHDRSLDERVALKVLSDTVRGSADADRRFRDEIKLARKIRHPNVCGIHEYGRDHDIQYIVMEFVDGEDLKKYVRSRGGLTTDAALDLAGQIGEGLQAIHDAGVIHRDLKLANVMRDQTGRLRLMDFGIAKFMGDSTVTATGQIIGTPEYMSPEQVQGLHLDPRSDLYSLGIMTYELLTGRVPFKADTPLATVMLQIHEPPRLSDPAIPPEVVPVLEKALAKEPEKRFESVRAFVAALAASRRTVQTQHLPDPMSAAQEPATVEIAPDPRLPNRVTAPVITRKAAEARAPVPPPASRLSPSLRGLAAVLVGLVVAVWVLVQVGVLLRARPGATPIATEQAPGSPPPSSTSNPQAESPSPAPIPQTEQARPATTSDPLPTSAPTLTASPNARIHERPSSFDGASDRPSADRKADRTPAATESSVPGATPAPTRTPLPTAVLKPLPSPTATPTLAAIPSPSPLPTIAPSPESSLTASNAASSVSSGFLQLGAKPYATVFIDGKEAGTLPMKPLELGEGRHVVRLVHPDYQPWQRTVTIRKGETSKLFLDWSLDGIPK